MFGKRCFKSADERYSWSIPCLDRVAWIVFNSGFSFFPRNKSSVCLFQKRKGHLGEGICRGPGHVSSFLSEGPTSTAFQLAVTFRAQVMPSRSAAGFQAIPKASLDTEICFACPSILTAEVLSPHNLHYTLEMPNEIAGVRPNAVSRPSSCPFFEGPSVLFCFLSHFFFFPFPTFFIFQRFILL